MQNQRPGPLFKGCELYWKLSGKLTASFILQNGESTAAPEAKEILLFFSCLQALLIAPSLIQT